MTEEDANMELEELTMKLNSWSDKAAQGDVLFSLSRNANEWIVEVKGSLCSGTDSDGSPYWRDVAEILNDTSWSGNNLKKLLEKVKDAVDEASL